MGAGGTAGTMGAAGRGGTAGSAGAAGTAGRGGTTGAGGVGGVAGAAGRGGTGGTGGASGATGSGGTTGSGGRGGTGGSGGSGTGGGPPDPGTPIGFATLNGGTTGGKGAQVVTATTYAELKMYAESSTAYVIRVQGTIANGANGGKVSIKSNKTIVGVASTAFLNGVGLEIANNNNVIIQNLRMTMMGVTTRTETAGVYTASDDEGVPAISSTGATSSRSAAPARISGSITASCSTRIRASRPTTTSTTA